MQATDVYADSSAATSAPTNPQVSERNKYIELKVHHVQDLIREEVVQLNHVPRSLQPVDPLTKAFTVPRIEALVKLINM